MRQARVVSTGSYLPGEPITNAELERFVGPLPEDVLAGLQVERRHWMADPATGAHRESNSSIATKAARRALDAGGIDVANVDLIVVSTASPDYLLPAMATLVQDQLGIERCATVELRSGAAGAVAGMDVARGYIERGDFETAVVIGSETISPLLVPMFLGKDPESVRMRDRVMLYNFGDGAGAVVLQATEDGNGIIGSALSSVGGGKKPGMRIIGGGTSTPLHEQSSRPRFMSFEVDVVEAGRFTPFVMSAALKSILEKCNVSAMSIDHCVIPEGNAAYVLDELRESGQITSEWTTLQSKIRENLAQVGATGSACVPLALDFSWRSGILHDGDRVMLAAIETSKWLFAGTVFPWSGGPSPTQESA